MVREALCEKVTVRLKLEGQKTSAVKSGGKCYWRRKPVWESCKVGLNTFSVGSERECCHSHRLLLRGADSQRKTNSFAHRGPTMMRLYSTMTSLCPNLVTAQATPFDRSM